MRYMMLIYLNESGFDVLSEAEQKAGLVEYQSFTSEVRRAGVLERGEPLARSTSATTVRIANGNRLTTDGPFAETKEQLAGYYILDCKTLDEALAYAAKIPAARYGAIEVRPIASI